PRMRDVQDRSRRRSHGGARLKLPRAQGEASARSRRLRVPPHPGLLHRHAHLYDRREGRGGHRGAGRRGRRAARGCRGSGMMEFLLVTFHEERDVLIDDVVAGLTNHIITLAAGHYQVSILGRRNFTPAEVAVDVDDTTILAPTEVTFV